MVSKKLPFRALPILLSAWALLAQGGPLQAQVTSVVVGVTPTCLYRADFPCWPGAKEALGELKDVRSVTSVPDSYNCTARVHLSHQGLPDIGDWSKKFKDMVGQTYVFRGVEITIKASVEMKEGKLSLNIPDVKQAVVLAPLQNKLQWNNKKNAVRQPEPDERKAYRKLAATLRKAKDTEFSVEVTGPLRQTEHGMVLEVREFFLIYTQADALRKNGDE